MMIDPDKPNDAAPEDDLTIAYMCGFAKGKQAQVALAAPVAAPVTDAEVEAVLEIAWGDKDWLSEHKAYMRAALESFLASRGQA
jgi:hypothetical protein